MGASGEVRHSIVLFDGVCNLCSGSVQFIIKRDPRKIFQFAALQSDFGQHQLEKFQVDTLAFNTIVLIHENRVYQRSNAALEIARQLHGGWKLLYGFKILPLFIRDGVYNWIANHRYSFFGKKDACWIPTPELSGRFLG